MNKKIIIVAIVCVVLVFSIIALIIVMKKDINPITNISSTKLVKELNEIVDSKEKAAQLMKSYLEESPATQGFAQEATPQNFEERADGYWFNIPIGVTFYRITKDGKIYEEFRGD